MTADATSTSPAGLDRVPRTRQLTPLDARLLRHASAARGYLLGAVGLGLVTTALVLTQAGLLARALAGAGQGTGLGALQGTLLALLVVLLARAAAAYGGEAAALRAAAVIKSQLRTRLTAHALRLGPSWLSGQQAGEITTLATKGLDALDAYFARYLPQLILSCLVPLAVLVRVAAADWISGLVILLTLPLIPVFAVLVGLQARARTQEQWGALSRLGGHFLDVVEGLPTLKLFGRATAQADVIRKVTDEHRTATMSALRIAFLSALVLELAAALATALVAVEVGLRLLAGQIGYETALLVLLLTPEAYLPLRNVGAQFHASAEGTAAAGRAFEILGQPWPAASSQRAGGAGRDGAAMDPDVAPGGRAGGAAPAVPVPDLATAPVTLRAVCLAYPGRPQPALADVTVTIRPGDRIVLTGPSGAGKSSLLGLLLRFTEPTSGQIEAGGVPLDRVPPGAWRRQLAWVPQRPYLFAGTIGENIALADPDASASTISRAARLAGAEQFILSMPGGYDARLGERGLTLSAGQRQRIALARAFLRDAPLVLLDEPTAHLDPGTAREILTVIASLTAGRTVLLVSHDEPPGWPGDVLRLEQGVLATVPAMRADAAASVPAGT